MSPAFHGDISDPSPVVISSGRSNLPLHPTLWQPEQSNSHREILQKVLDELSCIIYHKKSCNRGIRCGLKSRMTNPPPVTVHDLRCMKASLRVDPSDSIPIINRQLSIKTYKVRPLCISITQGGTYERKGKNKQHNL